MEFFLALEKVRLDSSSNKRNPSVEMWILERAGRPGNVGIISNI